MIYDPILPDGKDRVKKGLYRDKNCLLREFGSLRFFILIDFSFVIISQEILALRPHSLTNQVNILELLFCPLFRLPNLNIEKN